MEKQQTFKINYHQYGANLQVTPVLPQLSSHQTDWQYLGIQHHIQPAIQTPKFQPLQHLLVIHLRSEIEVERNLDGVSQRGYNLPGDVTVIPANCDYQLTTTHESEVLLLTLDTQWLFQLASASSHSTLPEIMPHFPQPDPLIHGIGLTLYNELKSGSCGDSLYIESLGNALSIHLLQKYSSQQYVSQNIYRGLPRYKLTQVLDYIDFHLERKISVADLCAIAKISRYHFATLFKESTGVSPYQYVLIKRIEKAKKLLKQGELSLVDIALACGFANQSHFIRRFRQLTGITPKAYRNATKTFLYYL